ncbi:MAG: single-stranded DNA-binding protein [Bacilli bacterium]|nr:single-stranded DNA-binding protein [Bacilli bacterium]
MGNTLAELKKRSNFSKLLEEVEKIKSPESGIKNYEDDRLWKLTIDKAGNGSALIRFLDAPQGEDSPWVTIYKHAFSYINGQVQPQGAKGGVWYIENSLTSIGQQDYVGEQNSELWNTGVESNKEIARKRKRTLNYYSNILVIKDPDHPENNGKVFLFRYGKKIFDIIAAAMQPPEVDPLDEDAIVGEAFNPFDFWSGANLALRINKVDGWPSYVNSKFQKPAPLFKGDDKKIEEIWKQEYSLKELLDPKHFKSYEELKARYLKVVNGISAGTVADEPDVNKFVDEKDEDVPNFNSEESFQDVKSPKPKDDDVPFDVGDDEDDLSFFQKLANGD